MPKVFQSILIGTAAGAVTGVLGTGGGLILVPLISSNASGANNSAFSASVTIMLPICCTVLLLQGQLPWTGAFPYLIGGFLGGIAAALFSRKIHTLFLHKLFGLFMLWGGIRFLCSH